MVLNVDYMELFLDYWLLGTDGGAPAGDERGIR